MRPRILHPRLPAEQQCQRTREALHRRSLLLGGSRRSKQRHRDTASCHPGIPVANRQLYQSRCSLLAERGSREASAANLRALELQPDDAIGLENGISSSSILDRTAEAAKYMAQAQRLGLNGTSLFANEISFLGSHADWTGVQKLLAETAGRLTSSPSPQHGGFSSHSSVKSNSHAPLFCVRLMRRRASRRRTRRRALSFSPPRPLDG